MAYARALDMNGGQPFYVKGFSCECDISCADRPDGGCPFNGTPHVHPLDEYGFGPCPVHPEAPCGPSAGEGRR